MPYEITEVTWAALIRELWDSTLVKASQMVDAGWPAGEFRAWLADCRPTRMELRALKLCAQGKILYESIMPHQLDKTS